jgi:hypothetical protein
VTDFERSWAESDIISLAGNIALQYARNRRYVARDEEVAIPEARHAVVALAVEITWTSYLSFRSRIGYRGRTAMHGRVVRKLRKSGFEGDTRAT